MNEWMTTFMDLDAGAASGRAGRKLEEKGRLAVPVVINHMKLLDLATEGGGSNGDLCQRTLQNLTNGRNFGWKYEGQPEDIYYNKKVVENWSKTWARIVDDVEFWIEMAKLEAKDPEEAKRLRELYGTADELDGFDDDLDVD